MELAIFVYLAGVIGSLNGVFHVIFIMTIITSVIFAGVNLIRYACASDNRDSDSCDKIRAFAPKQLRMSFTGMLIAGVISALVPSQKTVYVAMAAYGGQAAIESEFVQMVVDKGSLVVEEYFDAILVEAPQPTQGQ